MYLGEVFHSRKKFLSYMSIFGDAEVASREKNSYLGSLEAALTL